MSLLIQSIKRLGVICCPKTVPLELICAICHRTRQNKKGKNFTLWKNYELCWVTPKNYEHKKKQTKNAYLHCWVKNILFLCRRRFKKFWGATQHICYVHVRFCIDSIQQGRFFMKTKARPQTHY